MPPKIATPPIRDNALRGMLAKERNLELPAEIENSPLKTTITRADTAAFDFIMPSGSLDLGGGIGQLGKSAVANAFKQPAVGADVEKKMPERDFKHRLLASFAESTKSRFADRRGKLELPSKQEALVESHYASTLGRYMSKQAAHEKGIAQDSPIARLNVRTRMTPQERREFFREKAREKGFVASDETESGFDKLTAVERAKLGYAKLRDRFGGNSKWERGAFAIDMALDKAIVVSADEHQANSRTPELAGLNLHEAIAGAIDNSERHRDEWSKLTDAGIEAGKRALLKYLERDPDKSFSNAQDCKDLATVFGGWCAEYNAKVDERNALREERRSVMSGSVLKELGIPVMTMDELLGNSRCKTDLDAIFSTVESAYVKERGISVWKSLLAGAANILTLSLAGRASKWVRRHVQNVTGYEAMNREVNERFEAALHGYLREENRMNAENWVLEQYDAGPKLLGGKGPESLRGVSDEKLFDPHGLYAAFGNFSKEEILDSIERQLILSAGFSPDAPPQEGDQGFEGYQRFGRSLGAMATGIYEGMRDALHARADQQLRLRVADKLTADADTYVIVSNAVMRQNCHLAWQNVGDMLDSYDTPGGRQTGFARIADCKQEIENIAEEMAACDENGTFALKAAPADEDSPTDDSYVTLPLPGARRQLLEGNLQVARADIGLAAKVAEQVNGIMGDSGTPGSMRWIQEALDEHLLGLRYSRDGSESAQEMAARIRPLENALEALKQQAADLEGSLPKQQHSQLDDMLRELGERIVAQKSIHRNIMDVEKQLFEAKTAADIATADSAAARFFQNMELEADILTGMRHPVGVRGDALRSTLQSLRYRVQAQIDGTRQMLAAKEAAAAAIGNIGDQLAKGGITLRQAVTRAHQAASAVIQTRDDHAKDNIVDAALSAKFAGLQEELSDRIAGLLPIALGVQAVADDAQQGLKPEALRIARNLQAAGLDSEAVVAALKAELHGDNQLPSLGDVEKLLLTIGSNEQQVTAFADKLFGDRPEMALAFKLGMMRHNGATEAELAKVKHRHFTQAALSLVMNSQGAVNDAYNKTVGTAKQAVPAPAKAAPAKGDDSDSDLEIVTESDSDSDNDGGARRAQPVQYHVVDTVVELSTAHPLLNTLPPDWVKAAAEDLKQLIDANNDQPMTSEQISRARTFAAMFQGLAEDADALAQTRQAIEQADAQNVARQILAEFGLDEADLDDSDKVADVTTQMLIDKKNAPGMQDISRRSSAVRNLMAVQQQEAELVKGAVVRPLKEFASLVDPEQVKTADDVIGLMASKAFQAKAKVLQDLCRLSDAKDTAERKQARGLVDSGIYHANLLAMKELAPRLRGFDPQKLDAGNRTINRLAMWWKNETVEDVAKAVLDPKGQQMAQRFADVWRHLAMLNAIADSNEDLTRDLESLQVQHETLLTSVQRHRQDQLVALAILEECRSSGNAPGKLDLKDVEVLENIQKRLDDWKQPDAWQGFVSRNPELLAEGLTPAVVQKWKTESTGLPEALQLQYDELSQALTDFELLIEQSARTQSAIAGTPLDPTRAVQYDSDLVDASLQAMPPEKAGHRFRGMLNSGAVWHRHADWKGAAAKGMRDMTPDAFTRELKVGLMKFSQGIAVSRSGIRIGPSERQKDKEWISGRLIGLIDKAERFNSLLNLALENKAAGLDISDDKGKELHELGREIKEAALELRPGSSDGKLHRFRRRGPASHRYHVPNDHFLNAVDATLHRNLPIMVDEQLARLGT